jgi:hypothetical protein
VWKGRCTACGRESVWHCRLCTEILCGTEALANLYEAVAVAAGATRALPLILRGYLDHVSKVPGALRPQDSCRLPPRCELSHLPGKLGRTHTHLNSLPCRWRALHGFPINSFPITSLILKCSLRCRFEEFYT